MDKRTTIILEDLDQEMLRVIKVWTGSTDASSAIRYAIRQAGRKILGDDNFATSATAFLCKNGKDTP